jgi:hypothetical protein
MRSDRVDATAAEPGQRVGAALGLGCCGGISERRAAILAERDDALRALARIIGPGLPIERQAQAVAARLRRYRPTSIDASGGQARQALQRISNVGLPTPSLRHLRHILSWS